MTIIKLRLIDPCADLFERCTHLPCNP